MRQLEPPSADQVERYVRSALFQAGKLLARRIMDQLTPETADRLLTLIGVGDVPEDEDEEPDLLRMIKSSPGGVARQRGRHVLARRAPPRWGTPRTRQECAARGSALGRWVSSRMCAACHG